jgi:hypothetical protein
MGPGAGYTYNNATGKFDLARGYSGVVHFTPQQAAEIAKLYGNTQIASNITDPTNSEGFLNAIGDLWGSITGAGTRVVNWAKIHLGIGQHQSKRTQTQASPKQASVPNEQQPQSESLRRRFILSQISEGKALVGTPYARDIGGVAQGEYLNKNGIVLSQSPAGVRSAMDCIGLISYLFRTPDSYPATSFSDNPYFTDLRNSPPRPSDVIQMLYTDSLGPDGHVAYYAGSYGPRSDPRTRTPYTDQILESAQGIGVRWSTLSHLHHFLTTHYGDYVQNTYRWNGFNGRY